ERTRLARHTGEGIVGVIDLAKSVSHLLSITCCVVLIASGNRWLARQSVGRAGYLVPTIVEISGDCTSRIGHRVNGVIVVIAKGGISRIARLILLFRHMLRCQPGITVITHRRLLTSTARTGSGFVSR